MFFRREKPHQATFSEHMENLRNAGFAVQPEGAGARVSRGTCAAVVEDRGAGSLEVVRIGILVGGEIGDVVSGGFQSFVRTPGGKLAPALARDLMALHSFEEDFKETLGLTSLYNQSLGTTFDHHLYDRVVRRDAGVHKPWEKKTALHLAQS